MEKDQTQHAMHITKAVSVAPSNDRELDYPGSIFIDSLGTEGTANVTLLDGGDIVLDMVKCVPMPFIVKKVWVDGTTATGIYVHPVIVLS